MPENGEKDFSFRGLLKTIRLYSGNILKVAKLTCYCQKSYKKNILEEKEMDWKKRECTEDIASRRTGVGGVREMTAIWSHIGVGCLERLSAVSSASFI